EVRMYPRSGPRTDGRCAEGPRVEWFDGEARPTYDPARGAERPGFISPQQLFPKKKPSLPARGAERLGFISPQQLFLKEKPSLSVRGAERLCPYDPATTFLRNAPGS
ncbi:MAG TPA: hypothetical protein VKV73_14570, partial [Chloroflexota bacterium]|nr:hypothetical protein [Chloroflexota bacterium]